MIIFPLPHGTSPAISRQSITSHYCVYPCPVFKHPSCRRAGDHFGGQSSSESRQEVTEADSKATAWLRLHPQSQRSIAHFDREPQRHWLDALHTLRPERCRACLACLREKQPRVSRVRQCCTLRSLPAPSDTGDRRTFWVIWQEVFSTSSLYPNPNPMAPRRGGGGGSSGGGGGGGSSSFWLQTAELIGSDWTSAIYIANVVFAGILMVGLIGITIWNATIRKAAPGHKIFSNWYSFKLAMFLALLYVLLVLGKLDGFVVKH